MKIRAVIAMLMLACASLCARAASVEEEVAQRVERLRQANKAKELPVLRRIVTEELARKPASDLVLLEGGYFLATEKLESDRTLAWRALFAMNPQSPIARTHFDQMFRFARLAAEARDPRLLAFADRAFLRGDGSVVVAPHALRLDSTLAAVFIYGAYGAGAESHLLAKLKVPADAMRALEILGWIGTAESVGPVASALKGRGDYDFYTRAMNVLMTHGGPAGRDTMLGLDASRLDERARKMHQEYLPKFRAVQYAPMRESFGPVPAKPALSDADIRRRLKSMLDNDGVDADTSPAAILDSGIPSAELIAELVAIRARMFRRLSDEALSDVKVTNFLLNALRFRKTSP